MAVYYARGEPGQISQLIKSGTGMGLTSSGWWPQLFEVYIVFAGPAKNLRQLRMSGEAIGMETVVYSDSDAVMSLVEKLGPPPTRTESLESFLSRASLPFYGNTDKPYEDSRLAVNYETFEVRLNGSILDLTTTEFEVLSLLVKNAGNVVPHKNLYSIWEGSDKSVENLVKKYIIRLRKKLGDTNGRIIKNFVRTGYAYIPPA